MDKLALNVADLRQLARKRLPKVVFDYIDGGAEDGVGQRRNRQMLDSIALIPRVLRDVSRLDTSVDLFGVETRVPVGIAPTGGVTMVCYDGDVEMAQAAKELQIPFAMSTAAGIPVERVAQAGARLWYQYYPAKDQSAVPEILSRAKNAGAEALIATVDTAANANREYNTRNGLTWPLRISTQNVFDGVWHPGWVATVFMRYMLQGGLPMPKSSGGNGCDSFTWDELATLRRQWTGPLIVKGIVSPPDARQAIDIGADAVLVSNHGGRNLDHAISTIEALPQVVDAINGRGLVMFDSGVRRGSDIVKALALGADFVFVGCAPLYGLGAGGREGAVRAIRILEEEMRRVMAMCGSRNLAELTPELIA